MEKLNDLFNYDGLKIFQDSEAFNFSLDTALLARFVTIRKNTNQILDIGTGNAPIPLILSKRSQALITGVEIQREIFELAKKTVEYNNLATKIKLINQDVSEFYKERESDSFDTIVCNPPFFPKQEKGNLNKELKKTVARHELYLKLDDIFKIAKKLLKNNGNVAIIHRPERLVDIIISMKKNNIEPKKMRLVYPKRNREAYMLLIEGRKNGNSGLKIMPPLYIHTLNNNYTSEAKKMFQ